MINCPNDKNGICTVASSLINEEVAVSSTNCAVCDGSKNTYSGGLALLHLVQLKKFKPNKYPELHSIMFPGRKLYGPGNNLHNILNPLKVLFRIRGRCDCENVALIMNNMGRQWCLENLEFIVGKLRDNSIKLKVPFSYTLATIVVLLAIHFSKNRYDY